MNFQTSLLSLSYQPLNPPWEIIFYKIKKSLNSMGHYSETNL